jgi:HD superfamily phosphohydrolase
MRVFKGNIVIEKKGIYAIENYIIARRLMYMQVYQHKTVLSADFLLRSIFDRVRALIDAGADLQFASNALAYFLTKQPSAKKSISKEMLTHYMDMDDHDVFLNIKLWANSEDQILGELCNRFLNRNLFRTTFFDKKPTGSQKEEIRKKTQKTLKKLKLPADEQSINFFVSFERSYSEAYKYKNESIWILENEKAVEFSKAAETKNIIALTEPVVKHYCIHLKEITP